MPTDAADEGSCKTLTMGDLQLQDPRGFSPLSSKTLFPFKSAISTELLDFPENGLDFYSSPFDSSFPYPSIIVNNERSFSSSTPTPNTPFLSETPFMNNAQVLLKSPQESGIFNDGFGLLRTTSTPFRSTENGSENPHFHNERDLLTHDESFLTPPALLLNDSGLSVSPIGHVGQKWESPKTAASTSNTTHFDFSFQYNSTPGSGSGSSNGSSASADSPTRLINSNLSVVPFSWEATDISSQLQEPQAEGQVGSSVVTTLGNSIWSPVPNAVEKQPATDPGEPAKTLEEVLANLDKQQILAFKEVLKDKYGELLREDDTSGAAQVQNVMVTVQEHIIAKYLSEAGGSISSASSASTSVTSPRLPSPKDDDFDRLDKDIDESSDIPRYTWNGHLPSRNYKNPLYSCKVFLGGLPWDITEGTLMQVFKAFGIIKIEWPGKDGFNGKTKGYAYALFETEKQVKLLLQNCILDYSESPSGKFYFKITSKKFRGKNVQVIPWAQNDCNFVRCQASKIDPLKTVFVGAVHGMVNAEGLATIMNDLFENVIYAGIDTDKNKYPIGSARVTFNNEKSYMKAVTAKFIFIKTPSFGKRLQLDPYLSEASCSGCNLQQGPYFCRDRACFDYYCRSCFYIKHAEGTPYSGHRPMMRTTHRKPQSLNGFNGFSQQNHTYGNNGYNNDNGNFGGGGGRHHNNNHHQSGNGLGQQQYHQNHQHGFGGHHYNNNNGRQWNNNGGGGGGISGGRSVPAMNQLNSGSNQLSFNGQGGGGAGGMNKFNNYGNSAGGGQGGPGNNAHGNGHTSGQQASFGHHNCYNGNGNRNFGHRQQQGQFTRW